MKNKIIAFLFMSYLLSFSFLHIILKDKTMSTVERRNLTVISDVEFDSDFILDIDKYLLEQFPLRDEFRSLKANYNYKILRQLDNNDIYLKNDYIFKKDYPTNMKSIENFIDKTNKLNALLSESNNSYMLIVPDKNYYLDDEKFLHIDYDYIYEKINEIDVNKIDLRKVLSLDDYYKTDTHWKQENILKVTELLSNEINFEYKKLEYKYNTFDEFYGVYHGESALNRQAEQLTYLTNDIIDEAKVSYLENPNLSSVYNIQKLYSFDSYEVYLDGASSFIEIVNENSDTDKELIVFRDSFGSSLVPLLIPYYHKITVIDNRYISSQNFSKFISFDKQDVLFVYSTLIINNSFSLKG